MTTARNLLVVLRRPVLSLSLALPLLACAAPEDDTPTVAPTPPMVPEAAACTVVADHLECTYKTVGALAIQADVYGAEAGTARPALLWIHGGALLFGHRVELQEADDQLALYLEHGYVVVAIDYRLAPQTQLDLIHGDVADAYAWLRLHASELGVDANRIGVVGHSAGGYLTLSMGYRVEPRPRALVSFYGYGRITQPWYTAPSEAYLEEDRIAADDADIVAIRQGAPVSNSPLSELEQRAKLYVYCRQTGRWPVEVSGRDPAAERGWFADYEPLLHVDASYPPTILLHGQDDDDVPFAESEAMSAALEAAGVPVSFVHDGLPRYAGASFDHGFDEDLDVPRVRQAFDEALAFLDTHVRDAP